MRVLLILLCFVASMPMSLLYAQPLSCSPQPIQNPCNSQDIDQSGSTGSLLPRSALNPIDLYSGNKYLREVDLAPHPHAPELEIVRHYNAMDTRYGLFGGAWNLSYDARLLVSPTRVQLHQANGTLKSLGPEQGDLVSNPDHFIWFFRNGDAWHFNRDGWLIQLQRHSQAPLYIERHSQGDLKNRVKRIHQKHAVLELHYQSFSGHPPLLSHISSAQGTFYYHYTALKGSTLQQLQRVSYPDQRQLHYHYETALQAGNIWALTGKSIQLSPQSTPRRVRSWAYDSQGRAIFVMAESQQWVRLYYPDAEHPLQTRLQSPAGLTQVQFSASTPRTIQSVRGAACWACPPPFTRYADRIEFEHFTVYHDAQQHIRAIHGQFAGWPDLKLDYNAKGQLVRWQTAQLQPTRLFYHPNGLALRMEYANGDRQQLRYNAQQQVAAIDYHSAHQQLSTQLWRPSPQHLHISHPTEDEQLMFNPAGALLQRDVQRRLATPTGPIHWHYQERFHYDSDQYLVRHDLPEGGFLHYIWQKQQLIAIEWENRQGQRQRVIERGPDLDRYGNGLVQERAFSPTQVVQRLRSTKQIWWQQNLSKQAGLIVSAHQSYPVLNRPTASHHYYYNAKRQVVIDQPTNQNALFYAWKNTGELAAQNHLPTPTLQRDASGLIRHWSKNQEDYMLQYNALRRLDVVYKAGKTVQKNSHNAYGFRIYAQHYPQGKQQFFLYHNKKIIAEYQADITAKLPVYAAQPVSRRYIYFQNQPVGLIDYHLDPHGELLVMHSDHLGAVHIISDAQQRLRWAASYDVFGAATKIAGDLDFYLRREGQYYDLATGWHDNLLRTYVPDQGHYLEPDPLGPSPATQLFGYTQQQPLNHTDPWGLLLFAFDGTRYDQSSGGVISILHQAAQDPSFYVAGPGNPENVDLDAAFAHTANQIVQQQWSNLINYLKTTQEHSPSAVTPIDIIGFSRGSALALHFSNQVASHTHNGLFSYTDNYGEQIKACIQPRFIGLLDNVAQMGVAGANNHLYNFSVAPAWQWVVHGVAMHEHRYLFPLYSIGDNANSIEAGFIGAHGDLGGGYPQDPESEAKPLSDVALEWILWNARAQGLSFRDPQLKSGSYAYMHDENTSFNTDRRVQNYPLPFSLEHQLRQAQALHPVYGQSARREVRAFINTKLSAEEQKHNRSAKVDLEAYYLWLDQTLHWRPD